MRIAEERSADKFAKVEISRERVFMMMMLSRSSSRWRFWNVRVVVE